MKKSLQKNLKLILFVVLFLAVSIFCVLAFMVGSSSKVKAFASQETEVVAVQEEETGKIELEIVEINANNKTFDGKTDVPVSIKIANVVEGDDVSVIAKGTATASTVGIQKVNISNYEIIGEDKDKYSLPSQIDDSNVYTFIVKKSARLNWTPIDNNQSYVYDGVDHISSVSCYYINVYGQKVYLPFKISGYQVQNSITYTYSNSLLNAGNYEVEAIQTELDADYELKDLDGDKKLKITISRAKPEILVNSNRTFVYTGSLQNAGICATIKNNEQTLKFVNNTFTTVEEGNNLVVQASVDQSLNYMPASTTFTINVLKATSQIDISQINTNFVYTGIEQSISSGAQINNSEQSLVYQNNIFTTVSQANGRQVMVYAPETENYNYVSKTFEISMQKATINTSSWRWSASSFTYNGKMQTVTVLNYNTSLVTASYNGASNTEAGNYLASVVFVLRDSENYNPIVFESKEWEIKRATISVPNISDKTTTYSGQVQYACSLNSIYYTVSNNEQTNAGNYLVTIKLVSPSNTIWSNGSDEDVTFNWTILKAKVATPHVSKKFVYNGKLQTLDVEESDKYTILNKTAIDVGEHYCHLVLNDSANYEWAESQSSPILTLTWTIASSENYDESTPMVAVVITCVLVILICIYITLHFTVVKKRRSRKPNVQKTLENKEKQGNGLEQKEAIVQNEKIEQKDLATKNILVEESVQASKGTQVSTSQTVKEESVSKQKDVGSLEKEEISLGQTNIDLNNHTKEHIIKDSVDSVEEASFDEEEEDNNSSQDKARKKRMLSRKKEDKKKRRKITPKTTEPKKRGRPPKKQVATRGRPRREVSKRAPKNSVRPRTSNATKSKQ